MNNFGDSLEVRANLKSLNVCVRFCVLTFVFRQGRIHTHLNISKCVRYATLSPISTPINSKTSFSHSPHEKRLHCHRSYWRIVSCMLFIKPWIKSEANWKLITNGNIMEVSRVISPLHRPTCWHRKFIYFGGKLRFRPPNKLENFNNVGISSSLLNERRHEKCLCLKTFTLLTLTRVSEAGWCFIHF